MAQRELGKFGEWPLSELQHVEKSYPTGHLVGEEMRAEIRRRQNAADDQRSKSNLVFVALGVMIGIVTLILAAYTVIYRH
jgi:hypothetical protein